MNPAPPNMDYICLMTNKDRKLLYDRNKIVLGLIIGGAG